MKIIEIIPHLQTGGGEKFVVDLSNAFADKGHDCILVTLYDPRDNDLLRSYIQSNVVCRSVHKKPGPDLGCMLRLAALIRKEKPDIVHVHLEAVKYILLSALTYRKCAYFATLHSEAEREAGRGYSKHVRKFMFRHRLVAPVTISAESERSFERFYRFPAITIENGCAPYKSPANDDLKKYRAGVDMLFVHAGRIHNVKNQLMLVRAFAGLVAEGYNIRLLILGRITDNKLYDAIEEYESDRIVYLGEQQDTRAFMSVADCFCLSSVMEGMPITVIEALSVGCIPIVTPVGGCVNMIRDGINGFISTAVTVESYGNAIRRCLDTEPAVRDAVKKEAFECFKKKYSIDNTAQRYLNLFNSK